MFKSQCVVPIQDLWMMCRIADINCHDIACEYIKDPHIQNTIDKNRVFYYYLFIALSFF